MNGTLGRDKVWNDHIWNEIDRAVRDEMGRIRVAQKVFPTTVVNNLLPIPANTLAPRARTGPVVLKAEEDLFKAFMELSMEFVLTQAQVDAEEGMRLAATLGGLAASSLAAAEDTVIFRGKASIVSGPPHTIEGTGVSMTNRNSAPEGIIKEATNSSGPSANILVLLASGIAELNKRAQPGPYALFLSPSRYAEAFYPAAPGMLETPGDCINRVVTGGFYISNSLPPEFGILASLGGGAVKIILGMDATTAFTCIDAQGEYHFRVFERMQLIVGDGAAFQKLKF